MTPFASLGSLDENLLALLEQLITQFDNVDCYSIKGQGKATVDCDIAIDSFQSAKINQLNDSIVQYWLEPVPYGVSLTRHKFRVVSELLQE